MNECKNRTTPARLRDHLDEASRRLRFELHRGVGLTVHEAPDDFDGSEPTLRYPAGLREDLCSLSSCRPRLADRAL